MTFGLFTSIATFGFGLKEIIFHMEQQFMEMWAFLTLQTPLMVDPVPSLGLQLTFGSLEVLPLSL